MEVWPSFTKNLTSTPQDFKPPVNTGQNVIEKIQKRRYIHREFKLKISKPKKDFKDLFIHRCPGTKKIFKPDIKPIVRDFGETSSKIMTEICREIQYCRLRRLSSRNLKDNESEKEYITLSDVRERNRKYMSPEERYDIFFFFFFFYCKRKIIK
ncbi:hypothetical protein Phum_PHUM015340 [Pediculus humanus corporis]|uniref:Uncharacterized protein n=1 Tax=Pediculus humanus subsp. corporis TaxID=121224 RepID=E0V9L0_PEDHC|nr:uncharacterized protein Phum_PHUM015340 [Pediculus humanus corporis]EEB10066.1 hypothetical protein Phum_PHUM015340 [Pediculus humanus corporis]